MTDDEDSATDPIEPSLVGTYGWTDAHGEPGTVDILAGLEADPPVEARIPDAGEVVAVVDGQGRPAWSDRQLRANGLDTAAARNDLIEVIRQTYRDLDESR